MEAGMGTRESGVDAGDPGQTTEDGGTDSNGVTTNFPEQEWLHAGDWFHPGDTDWACLTSQSHLHMPTAIPFQPLAWQSNEWSDLMLAEGGGATSNRDGSLPVDQSTWTFAGPAAAPPDVATGYGCSQSDSCCNGGQDHGSRESAGPSGC